MRLQHGLVDKLGSYRDALTLRRSAPSSGDDYKVEYIEPPLGWRQALAQQSQVLAARVDACAGAGAGIVAAQARKLFVADRSRARAPRAVQGSDADVLLLHVLGALS